MQFYAAIITRLPRFSMLSRRTRIALAAFVLAAFSGGAVSVRAAPVCPQLPPATRATVAPGTPLQVRADNVSAARDGTSEFSGAVELERGTQQLNAEQLRYDRSTDRADASGDVRFQDQSGDSYRTSELHLTLGAHTGYTGPGSYTLGTNRARGQAQRMDFEGPDRTRLTDVSYTTCAAGQDDWFLNIGELELDTAEEIGTARNAWVEFKGVPLFYFPYLNFPISERRRSGFLAPSVGHSGKSGFALATPYYLNLAPNYDDTLTPRWLSKRGLQLQNEFRYLTRDSGGRLQLEALPDDRKYGDDRAAGSWQHQTTLSSLWSATVDVRAVSDKTYLDDFGDNLNITGQTHLPQLATLDYRGPQWNFSGRTAAYQTVDPSIAPADKPYARLPQLGLRTAAAPVPNRLNYDFDSELVRFTRTDSLTGERLMLNPGISLPLTASYGNLTPRVAARQIAYRLNRDDETTPGVARGVFSLDGGLVFERDSDSFGANSTQTLEPRLFYLYVPYRNQDNLPNFDTSIPDFSFSNLFRDNRLVGGDRIGDANQLTTAVTTRFFDGADGAERMRASFGRIHYFDDRRVNLPAGTVDTTDSNWVAELGARLPGHWYARGDLQWNHDVTAKYNAYLQYQPQADRIVNLGTRYIRDEIDQSDLSAEWPVFGRWTFRGRSLYSYRDRRNVESWGGFEYNACCWAARVLASRRYSDADGQTNALLLEFELNGLAKLGGVPDSPLRQSMFSFPKETQR
jgi:LPS-assembly protein